MHPNTQKIQTALEARGYDGQVVEFPMSTRTSQEAADAIGIEVGQIAKSIVFRSGDRGVLVITSGSNRVSTVKVGRLIGNEVERAGADDVRRLTGFPIGGVPPVGHAHELIVLIDEDLLTHEEVWSAAGTPNAVFPTTPTALAEMSGGRVADIKE